MNSKISGETTPTDVVRLSLALSILLLGLYGFYYFSEVSKLFRVLGILASVGLAIAIGLQTERGKQLKLFAKEANIEVRKVVWPTRQETMTTTLFVVIVVIIFGILLWVLDLILSSGVQSLIGQGG